MQKRACEGLVCHIVLQRKIGKAVLHSKKKNHVTMPRGSAHASQVGSGGAEVLLYPPTHLRGAGSTPGIVTFVYLQ